MLRWRDPKGALLECRERLHESQALLQIFQEHWALCLIKPLDVAIRGVGMMSEISRQSPNVLAQGRFRILLWFRALKVLHYVSELVTELETSTSSHLYQNASGPDSWVLVGYFCYNKTLIRIKNEIFEIWPQQGNQIQG